MTRTRIFKSGNSLAMRLPKELGFALGEDVIVLPHADGSLSIWRAADDHSVFLKLFGGLSSDFMADGRGDTEQVERDWSADRPDTTAAA